MERTSHEQKTAARSGALLRYVPRVRGAGVALFAVLAAMMSLAGLPGPAVRVFGIPPAAGAPAAAGSQSAPVARVSGDRAYQHVLALSQKIGPHPGGTPQDRTSGEYIASQLARDGCTVEWQPFTFPYFAVRRVALTVTDGPALHPRVMEYSPSTGEHGLTGEVVDAGLGRPGDFGGQTAAGVALRGKIVLVRRGELTFRQKADNAADAGAAAIIVYNTQPNEFAGTLLQRTRIPAVALSGTEGQTLRDRVRAGRTIAHLDVQTVDEQRTTWNIVGTKAPAAGAGGKVLIIGAHRDTVAGAPGANDNTSGVASGLETAEVLKDVPLGVTVRFVFFGAEEDGLYGSAEYVRHLDRSRVVGMINLDMEGVGDRLIVAGRGDDTLVRTASRLAETLGIRVEVHGAEGGSDHVNFERAGVPVVFLFRPDDPYYDTPRDTVDRVSPALLAASTRLAVATALAAVSP
ncbi:MAG TPA: M28 family metallopeptidase [bacterium]|nr:M28 family metallopeptidase [bacterium]